MSRRPFDYPITWVVLIFIGGAAMAILVASAWGLMP